MSETSKTEVAPNGKLTKRQVVLKTDRMINEFTLPNFEEFESVEFYDTDLDEAPEDKSGFHNCYFMDLATWTDMGSPDEITVTVEPGDKLNELERKDT